MSVKHIPLAALLLLPAACQQPAPVANQQAASVSADQQNIATLPERSRNAVFLRAINDAGFDCQTVKSASPHAPIKGHPAWSVMCERNTPYVAIIDANGYVQIVRGTLVDSGKTG